ncbi:family 43 glycosylhydrolase [Thermophagus sp. OGC60D27]|uniref:family 43 glycosylhydrolase n=1 Tax=Thermophagus sp. OGC60D27 TaxID=3458415 RepID=UPI004037CDE1
MQKFFLFFLLAISSSFVHSESTPLEQDKLSIKVSHSENQKEIPFHSYHFNPSNDSNSPITIIRFPLKAKTSIKIANSTLNNIESHSTSSPPRFKQTNNQILFNISKPQKLVLKLGQNNPKTIIILADSTNQEKPNCEQVIFFGPGEHNLPDPIRPLDNDTIFFAEGAVVKGRIELNSAKNITIKGTGILDGSECSSGLPLISSNAVKNKVSIEDVTLINQNGPVLKAINTQVKIKNVTALSFGPKAKGLIPGSDSEIKNTLIWAQNNAIEIKESNLDIKSISVLQGEYGAAFHISTIGTTNTENVQIENCKITHLCPSIDNPDVASFSIFNQNAGEIKQVKIQNIEVNQAGGRVFSLQTHILPGIGKKPDPGNIENIQFSNIKIQTLQPKHARRLNIIRGHQPHPNIRNIKLENIILNGYSIESPDDGHFFIGSKSTKNIEFLSTTHNVKKISSPDNSPARLKPCPSSVESGLNSYGNKDFHIFMENEKFYLTATEQTNPLWDKRGIILYESTDMQNWHEKAVLISRSEIPDSAWFRDEWRAPEIHKISNKYYLTFNNRNNKTNPYKKTGLGIAVASQLTGPYKILNPDKPLLLGNNATLFTDENDSTFCFWDMDGYLFMAPLKLSENEAVLSDDIREIFSPETHENYHFSDAPFVMKKNNQYILVFSQFYGGYIVRIRQMKADNINGPWNFIDEGAIMTFFEHEANDQLKMPYKKGYTFAPPTQVIFNHHIFKGTGDQYYMSWHTSEKYAEPYLQIKPIKFRGNGKIDVCQ